MVAKAKAGELNLARTIWGLRAHERRTDGKYAQLAELMQSRAMRRDRLCGAEGLREALGGGAVLQLKDCSETGTNTSLHIIGYNFAQFSRKIVDCARQSKNDGPQRLSDIGSEIQNLCGQLADTIFEIPQFD